MNDVRARAPGLRVQRRRLLFAPPRPLPGIDVPLAFIRRRGEGSALQPPPVDPRALPITRNNLVVPGLRGRLPRSQPAIHSAVPPRCGSNESNDSDGDGDGNGVSMLLRGGCDCGVMADGYGERLGGRVGPPLQNGSGSNESDESNDSDGNGVSMLLRGGCDCGVMADGYGERPGGRVGPPLQNGDGGW